MAAINENGHWSTTEQDKGLPELLPVLGEKLAEMELQRECRIAAAAAPLNPEEADVIAWPDMKGWTPVLEKQFGESEQDGETTGTEAEAETNPEEPLELPVLRYCVRVACASPVAWDAPPAVFLYSSHPTGSVEWMWWMYIDPFASGRAPEPGGYCTETGALADEYQG